MTVRDTLRRLSIQLFNWEYWPWKIVYLPLFLQYFWHGLRSGFTFPTVLNRPYMQYGGILEESKWKIYLKTPAGLMPPTLLLPAGSNAGTVEKLLEEAPYSYPIILKPDRGMRGKGVDLISSEQELQKWKPHQDFDYILQPYLDLPCEIGVFMLKHPSKKHWVVSSLMERQFLSVTGDGSSTLEQLIRKNDRAFMQLRRWQKNATYQLNSIPAKGETVKLGSIGNHRLGTCFRDINHRLTPGLKKAFISIAQKLPGFTYGRMDIRFRSWEELEKLQHWSLIEVNGTNSEPAHIYDPQHSIFYGWQVLLRHFSWQYQLARQVLKKGEKPITLKQAKQLLSRYNRAMQDLD